MGFERLVVIGVGLIGGSFALAARERGLVDHVVGVARKQATREAALAGGIADEATPDAATAAREADLVYISVPVGSVASVMRTIASSLRPGALVTDAGSTKVSALAAAREHLPAHCSFIGGHPMAGSEQSGPQAARADLFDGRSYFLTPTEDTPPEALTQLRSLLDAIGANVHLCDAREHDRMVALTSHLPHLLASALCSVLADQAGDGQWAGGAFMGSGFRDLTRIAKSPSEVWRDILLDNCAQVRAAAAALHERIGEYLRAMDEGDDAGLQKLWESAAGFRRGLEEP